MHSGCSTWDEVCGLLPKNAIIINYRIRICLILWPMDKLDERWAKIHWLIECFSKECPHFKQYSLQRNLYPVCICMCFHLAEHHYFGYFIAVMFCLCSFSVWSWAYKSIKCMNTCLCIVFLFLFPFCIIWSCLIKTEVQWNLSRCV